MTKYALKRGVNMTRRYALRDDQWERIKDLLPGKEGDVGVTAKDNRYEVSYNTYSDIMYFKIE
jgi:hypothetical protein